MTEFENSFSNTQRFVEKQHSLFHFIINQIMTSVGKSKIRQVDITAHYAPINQSINQSFSLNRIFAHSKTGATSQLSE